MKKLSSLSIFFPCLNDGKILPYLLAKTYWIAPRIAKKFEVIIIENGSIDETPQILTMLESQYTNLHVIRFQKPLGYGRTLKQGFARATNEWVFYTDGDGQYDPLDLPKLVEKCDDVDVVNGYKIHRIDRWYRTFLGNLYNSIVQKIYHPPVRDVDCDFRLIRRSFLKSISLESRSGTICLELVLKLKKADARFAEVGVSHYPRVFGRSEFFRLPHLMQTVIDYWHFS